MPEICRCPRCDGELSGDVPEGLCPECLFRQALAGPGTAPYRDEASPSPASVFAPPSPAELAAHFPQLEIVRLLGQGGMGAVYLARQPELDRLVAVKVLPPEVARDPGFMERFTREARALARLNHANVVTIFDFGVSDGLYYFTMEYVDGKNVRELLEAGALAAPQALKIIAQVCDGLQYAHDEGFVHRDIKPANILLDSKGRVKIADFGLARLVGLTPTYLTLTGSAEVMGTLYYMAPEQLRRAHTVDHRADLYSLGVVFYEMLTGELPIGRFGPPSQRAGVDGRLDAIVLRALAREPEQRHQDAAQIKREVEAALAGEPTAQAEPAVPARPAAWPAIQPVFPCVRFNIPRMEFTSASAEGEIYRTETTLIMDFSLVKVLDPKKLLETVRIPLAEILMISCHAPPPTAWPRWLVGGTAEIVLKVHKPRLLDKLPAGALGRGRLQVHPGDIEAAQQLVASIFHTPLPAPARPSATPDPPISAYDRVRRQLVGPAVALLVTAAVAMAGTVVLAGGFAVKLDQPEMAAELYLLVAVTALVATLGPGLMFAGAFRMLRVRSHRLCVAAALLAVLPWPGWPIGPAAGIWALVVLARPEVLAAFLDQRRSASAGPTGASEATGEGTGNVRSWLRSFAGYFLTTFPGRRAGRRGAQGELEKGE